MVSMKVIVDLCVVPIGVGVSVSEHVAACARVLKEAGLKTFMHARDRPCYGRTADIHYHPFRDTNRSYAKHGIENRKR